MALAALLVTALAAQGHAASGQSGKHPAARPSGIQHGALWLPRAVIREIRKAGVQPAIPPTWLPPVGGWLHGRRVTSAWPIVGAVAPNNGYLVDTSSREDVDESDIAFFEGTNIADADVPHGVPVVLSISAVGLRGVVGHYEAPGRGDPTSLSQVCWDSGGVRYTLRWLGGTRQHDQDDDDGQ